MPAGVNLRPALAAAVSAVPPVVLLAITHLTVMLTRAGREQEVGDAVSLIIENATELPQVTEDAPDNEPITSRKPSARPITGQDKTREWKQARAIDLYRQGETTRTIATELGVAKATVNRWLAAVRQTVPPQVKPTKEGTEHA
jgi:DNA-binding NarL/FixJ family response regulator